MKSFKKLNSGIILDSIGLFLMGFFSLSYLLFHRSFAELHIQFPFLNFPIFVGEILLFLCLILLLIRCKSNFPKFNIWYYLLFAYLGFVLLKAFWGYFKWGPLAFRHAALFYYPLFAIFGCIFYKRNFFNKYSILILSLLLIFILKFNLFVCFILAFVLIKAYPNNIVKYALLFVLLILTPYKLFFLGSRTALVSNVLAGIFTIFALILILRIKIKFKIILLSSCVFFLLLGTVKIAPVNELKSIVDIQGLISYYEGLNKVVAEKKKHFKTKEIEAVIYKPEAKRVKKLFAKDKNLNIETQREKIQSITTEDLELKLQNAERLLGAVSFASKRVKMMPWKHLQTKKAKGKTENRLKVLQFRLKQTIALLEKVLSQTIETEKLQETKKVQKEIEESLFNLTKVQKEIEPKPPIVRKVQGAHGSTFFRVFIWKDMLSQLMKSKPLFGFDFGKPLRSKTIEMLDVASEDWGTCGWITAHNSYLNVIYRAGIVGVIYIGFIIFFLFKMIKRTVESKSVTGILLCAVLVNWLISAHFFVILELPYNAIPFWSLFGVVFAYIQRLKNQTDKLH